MTKKSIIYLDIMVDGRFYKQIAMEYCPLFPMKSEEIKDYVISKVPSLSKKKFVIGFSSNKVL